MEKNNSMDSEVGQPARFEKAYGWKEWRARVKHDARMVEWQSKVLWLAHLVRWDTMFMISNRVAGVTCEEMELEIKDWMRGFPGVPTGYAIGLHPNGHGAHCHGVMRLAARGILRRTMFESAFERFGRCDFREPRDVGAVLGYFTKPCGEALKHGNWGLIGVCQNRRKVAHLLRRHVPLVFPAVTKDVITVEDVIEGNKGLPGPELELDLKEQVNLWK
jgi:hypothetical protein